MGFGKNYLNNVNNSLSIIISTLEDEPVQYEVFSPHGYFARGTISPSSYVSIILDSSLVVLSDTERNKGIKVRATDPSKQIFVSGLNYKQSTSDAFLALPTGTAIDEEYTYIINSVAWANRTSASLSSLILIVGTQDNTVLTITPSEYVTIPHDLRDSSNTQTFIHPGQSYTVMLDQLQTYQIESALDLTGSKIVSNKPLSVFTGHECADIPAGVSSCDHLFEQVPPTSTWGKVFFLVSSDSVSRTSPEWYRIVSSEPSTTISLTCFLQDDSLHSFSYQAYIVSVGGFEQFPVEQNNYCYVLTDKPVLVMNYAYGALANQRWGDPFMMMVLPTEQYITNTTVNFYAFENFTSDITIVVLQQDVPAIGSVLLDNSSVDSDWTLLYCSEEELCGYTLHMQVSTGFHSFRHINSSIPVAVYVRGFEKSRSYGYPASMALRS